jgi:hypothetical protein
MYRRSVIDMPLQYLHLTVSYSCVHDPAYTGHMRVTITSYEITT